MTFLKIAFFSMFKHLKRTLLVIFAVALSVLVMETVAGMMEGMKLNFFQNMLGSQGHLQIHGKGWKDRLDPFSLQYLVQEPEASAEKLRSDDRVAQAEVVMNFGALLVHGEKNIAMNGYGLGPETEFFSNVRDNLSSGLFLPEGEGVVLSVKTAALLGLTLGDRVNVITDDSTGSPYYLTLPVTATFDSGSRDFDSSHFFISLANSRELLYLDNGATEIRIVFFDRDVSTAFKSDLINGALGNFDDVEIETWQEVNGSLLVMFEFFDFFMIIINVFIIVVAATVIMNTLLMNVFEKLKEYGTMRAIGMKKRNLFGLIVLEGSVQGAAGSLLGIAVGISIVLYLQTHGLDWGEFADALGMGNSFRFSYTPFSTFKSLVSGILIAVASSLYAAGVIIRKPVVDTIV